MAYIYVLKNKINNKCYVGQTINVKARLNDHKSAKSNSCIHRAIRKYNWENFQSYIFQIPEELLDYYEIEMLKNLNTLSPNGYNLETGGHKNKHLHVDTKKKISKNHADFKGKKHPMYGKKGDKCVWYGKQHTEEEKKKISESHKGKHFTKKHKENLSKSRKGKYDGKYNPHSKKVICLENGYIFDTIKEASIIMNACKCVICDCCKGKRKTSGGYHWMYYEDYLKQNKKDVA